MPSSAYTRTPRVTKGAIVQFPPGIVPIPNIIPFQYNPARVRRTLTPSLEVAPQHSGEVSDQLPQCSLVAPTVQPCDPVESISMEIELDASDDLEEQNAIAQEFGIAPRIAALEKLLFATEDLLGSLLALVGSPLAPEKRPQVPIALLVWGIGRIVPIRVTSYQIEETSFLPNLRPLQATVSISFEVLSSFMFRGEQGLSVTLAKAAYDFYRVQQEVLAVLNLVNVAANVAGSVSLSIKV